MNKTIITIIIGIIVGITACSPDHHAYFLPKHRVPKTLKEKMTVFTGDSNTYAIDNLPGWNLAWPGNRIEDITAQAPALQQFHPWILVVMIGSNDANDSLSDTEFRDQYRDMMDALEGSALQVIYVSMPPVALGVCLEVDGVTKCRDNTDLIRLNRVIAELCAERGQFFYDIYHLFLDDDYFRADKTHFSKAGQNRYIEAMSWLGLVCED